VKFRSETLTYVTKLAEAGVDVEFHLYPEVFHAFDIIGGDVDISVYARNEYVKAVKKGFERVRK